MWADPVLVDLVRQQTDAFNRDASVDEKMALKEKIDARKRQLAAENH
jgi:hypothetical protein